MIKIKFNLTVNNYNGGPKIRIYNNKNVLVETTLSEKGHNNLDIETDLKFPTKIIIEHHGKDMNTDTKLEDGGIVDDKGFTLETIQFDQFKLHNELYLFKFIKEDGEEIMNNNYIGYNGKYIINIDSENLSTWYYKLQKSFVNQLENFDYKDFKKEIFRNEHCEVEY
tara:strand:+ start:2450 stop:2950 length:501 start_codon:yes stop_codon:yes gene_type:complete